MFFVLVYPRISSIAPNALLFSVQQFVCLRNIMNIGRRCRMLFIRPRESSTPICIFIPKCHLLSFLVWCISGSRSLRLFFVDVGADIILASTILPSCNFRPYSSRYSWSESNRCLPSLCFPQSYE